MNLVIIGSGAREHAMAWKLIESRRVDKIYCVGKNAGIDTLCTCVSDIKETPEDSLIVYSDKPLEIEGEYTELPCFLSDSKLYPIAAVCVEDDRAFVSPWEIDADKIYESVKSEINENLDGFGIITLYTTKDGKLISVQKGFGGFGAVTVLPVLRGDFCKMLYQCKNGEAPEFKVLNSCSVVRRHSETGKKVTGLSQIPGSVGVFINDCEFNGKMITTGRIPLYIAARGDTKEKSAEALSLAEGFIGFED